MNIVRLDIISYIVIDYYSIIAEFTGKFEKGGNLKGPGKYMINVGINQASAVMREPYRTFQTDPHAKAVMESAMAEVVALSKALGTGLEDSDIRAWYTILSGLGADGKTSMLQDVEAGRITEVEAFAGTVMELGRTTGVPVPVNTLLYHLIKAAERKYSKTS